MRELILDIVGKFLGGAEAAFLVYLILYSTFLLVAVIIGSVSLYQTNKKKDSKTPLNRLTAFP